MALLELEDVVVGYGSLEVLHGVSLTVEECEAAVQWVGSDGATAAGPDAIALLLLDAGRWWRVAVPVPGRRGDERLGVRWPTR